MKKILLLGGSAQQVIAIETAKKLGYYTVLCDFLTDNPGQYVADKFYLVSTTDKDAVLEVAQKEKVDGVLAYASDPAAPTAAYVGEKLKLPTNPYSAVDILCNKDRFRAFLQDNGFNAPVSMGYRTIEDAIADTSRFRLPVIIKPVDSSGSKGATVLHSWDNVTDALEFAFSFSRAHRVIIEEYIEKKHPYLIGGDIFVLNGKVVIWGLLTDVYEYSGKYSNLDALSRFIEYLKFYDEATDYMEVEGMIQDLHEIWYDFDIETLTEEDAGVYVDRVIQMAEANGAEIQIW